MSKVYKHEYLTCKCGNRFLFNAISTDMHIGQRCDVCGRVYNVDGKLRNCNSNQIIDWCDANTGKIQKAPGIQQ